MVVCKDFRNFWKYAGIDMRRRVSMGSFLFASALYLVVVTFVTLVLLARSRYVVSVITPRSGAENGSYYTLNTDDGVTVTQLMSTQSEDSVNVTDELNILLKLSNIDSELQEEVKSNILGYNNLDVGRKSMNASLNDPISRGVALDSTDLMSGRTMSSSRTIKIGLYHLFHGGLKFQARRLQMKSCQYNNCKISFIRQTANKPYDVDALLLQGNNVPNVLPVHRDTNQAFVFLSVESPQHLKYTNLNDHKFRNLFNWTMTYRMDSDIFYPYGKILPKSLYTSNEVTNGSVNEERVDDDYKYSGGEQGKDYGALYDRKSKTAAWIVSHCETQSKREKYVEKMKNITDVNIFGECVNQKCRRKDPDCEKRVVTEHKFYLAFENSLCKDYITEKVYKWFRRDIILVARGATNYKDHLPNGTYVDTGDFDSAEQLAKYLVQLGANKEEYVRMLRRKDSFIALSHYSNTQAAYCKLCKMLNNVDDYRKSIDNIDDWWTKGICVRPEL